MELISKWLSGNQNFHIGVVLFKRFSKDSKLKILFSGSPSSSKQARLVKELKNLLVKSPDIVRSNTLVPSTDEMPDTRDPVLKALKNEWLPSYQRMQYLRYELDKITGNTAEAVAQRHVIAKEVLQLEQLCAAVWSRRDHYHEHGTLPESKVNEDPLPTDPIELGRLIEATKRNLRRNKKLVKDFPADVTYPLKVIQYQKQLDRIMKPISDGKGS